MKKVIVLGAAGLLMLGAASQASAAFWNQGDLIMSIYSEGANQEIGLDLGALSYNLSGALTLTPNALTGSAQTAIASIINKTNLTSTSGIGVYSAKGTPASGQSNEGWFASTQSSGTVALGNASALIAYKTGVNSVQNLYYKANDTLSDGVADGISTFGYKTTGNAYNVKMNTAGAGTYQGLNTTVGYEAELVTAKNAGFVDMYLYHVNGAAPVLAGDTYEAVIRLAADGTVTFTPNAVPVPGAAWLLGSGLIGLAGLRRKKNS